MEYIFGQMLSIHTGSSIDLSLSFKWIDIVMVNFRASKNDSESGARSEPITVKVQMGQSSTCEMEQGCVWLNHMLRGCVPEGVNLSFC